MLGRYFDAWEDHRVLAYLRVFPIVGNQPSDDFGNLSDSDRRKYPVNAQALRLLRRVGADRFNALVLQRIRRRGLLAKLRG